MAAVFALEELQQTQSNNNNNNNNGKISELEKQVNFPGADRGARGLRAARVRGPGRATPPDVIEDVEARGFVSVTQDRRRCELRLAHPLYAEVVRSTMPTLRRRKLLLDAADRITAYGARRRDDSLRIATWRLDGDGHADPELLVRAARIARAGARLRPGRPVGAGGARPGGGRRGRRYLLGEALYETAGFDDADEVLAGAEVSAGSDHRRMLASLARAKNLFWGRLDPPAAIAVLDAAIGAVADPAIATSWPSSGRRSPSSTGARPMASMSSARWVPVATIDRRSCGRWWRALLWRWPVRPLPRSNRPAGLRDPQHLRRPDRHGPAGDARRQPGPRADRGRSPGRGRRPGRRRPRDRRRRPARLRPGLVPLSSGRVEVQRGRLITAHRWFADAMAKARSHEIHGPRRSR